MIRYHSSSDIFCGVVLLLAGVIVLGLALIGRLPDKTISDPYPFMPDKYDYVVCDYGDEGIVQIPSTLSTRNGDDVYIKHHLLSFVVKDINHVCTLPE